MPSQSTWSHAFRTDTTPYIAEPFFACLAEAIATVECAGGTRVIRGPFSCDLMGLNEIGYKAIPGKPSALVDTHEAPAASSKFEPRTSNLSAATLRFRLFRDRAEQAASLLFLLRSSVYYDAARLLFILAFYAAYAPGRTAGSRALIHVFNQLAAAGDYPGVRPIALFASSSSLPSDADTLALNHAAAREAVRLFAELTQTGAKP